MSGFELWICGVESDRSTNWATTTDQYYENVTALAYYEAVAEMASKAEGRSDS